MYEHGETCSMCGGDGRIGNAFGAMKTCPACHGSGRRNVEEGGLMRDVTKTKGQTWSKPGPEPSAPKPTSPQSADGARLAAEVKAAAVSETTKARLINSIIDYEIEHGGCTKTFSKKLRKQLKESS